MPIPVVCARLPTPERVSEPREGRFECNHNQPQIYMYNERSGKTGDLGSAVTGVQNGLMGTSKPAQYEAKLNDSPKNGENAAR